MRKDGEEQTVDELAGQLQQYEESLSSSLWACVSAVEKLFEKLSQEFQQFKEDTSCSHLYTPVSHPVGVSIPPLKREDTEGTHHGAPCGFTCVTVERT